MAGHRPGCIAWISLLSQTPSISNGLPALCQGQCILANFWLGSLWPAANAGHCLEKTLGMSLFPVLRWGQGPETLPGSFHLPPGRALPLRLGRNGVHILDKQRSPRASGASFGAAVATELLGHWELGHRPSHKCHRLLLSVLFPVASSEAQLSLSMGRMAGGRQGEAADTSLWVREAQHPPLDSSGKQRDWTKQVFTLTWVLSKEGTPCVAWCPYTLCLASSPCLAHGHTLSQKHSVHHLRGLLPRWCLLAPFLVCWALLTSSHGWHCSRPSHRWGRGDAEVACSCRAEGTEPGWPQGLCCSAVSLHGPGKV